MKDKDADKMVSFDLRRDSVIEESRKEGKPLEEKSSAAKKMQDIFFTTVDNNKRITDRPFYYMT